MFRERSACVLATTRLLKAMRKTKQPTTMAWICASPICTFTNTGLDMVKLPQALMEKWVSTDGHSQRIAKAKAKACLSPFFYT